MAKLIKILGKKFITSSDSIIDVANRITFLKGYVHVHTCRLYTHKTCTLHTQHTHSYITTKSLLKSLCWYGINNEELKGEVKYIYTDGVYV